MQNICFSLFALATMVSAAHAEQAPAVAPYSADRFALRDWRASDLPSVAFSNSPEPLPPVEPYELELWSEHAAQAPQYGPRAWLEPDVTNQATDLNEPSTVPSAEVPSRGPGMGSPAFGPGGKSPFRLGGYFAPPAQVNGQVADLTMSGQQLDAALPIFVLPAERGLWLAMFNFEHMQLSTVAVLPDTLQPVPNDLWTVSWGVMHVRKLDNGFQMGGMVSLGSASDRPFAALRDMTFTTLAFLNIPTRNERDAWNFSLFYSPTSQIPFPIPGVAYAWRPSEQFQANIGVPFSFNYQPTASCAVSASYMPLTNVRLTVRQQISAAWYVCTGYQSVTQTYFLADRVDDQERFYVFDQRVHLGLERSLGRGFTVDLTTAYLFDRRLFQATKFTGNRSDELSVASGLGTSLNISWRR